MPRPLPDETPPRLVELLNERKLFDLTALAAKAGLNAGTVHKLVTRNKQRPLSIYRKLARALGCEKLDEIYPVLTTDDITYRKVWIEERMKSRKIESQSHLCRISGVNKGTISDVIAGKISCSTLKTYKAVSDGLAIDLEEFADIFG